MLHIEFDKLKGLKFSTPTSTAGNEPTCIGYGQSPETGVCYIVGSSWDQANNRTRISTHLFKEVTFIGPLNV